MKDALIAMSKNWGFMCNNIIFTLLYSCQNALATVLGEIATVYGFEPEEASLFGVTIIVGAVIGSILYGFLLEKLKNYKSVLVFICIASTISTTALIYIMPSGVIEYVAAVFFCIGFNIISVAVVCFDLGVEQLYPLGESFSPTILNLSDAIGTLILISLCTTLLEGANFEETGNQDGAYQILWLFPFMCFTAFIITFVFKVELNRQNAENAAEAIETLFLANPQQPECVQMDPGINGTAILESDASLDN